MDDDTELGGVADRFPATQYTLVRAAASAEPAERRAAEATLVAAYWKPIYKHIRCHWRLPNEDAKDATQGFLTRAVERGFFERFDPAKGRFRTFVRVCVDRFLANEHRASARRQHGLGTPRSLDFDGAEGELREQPAAPDGDPDEFFRQEWLRGLFADAVEELRGQCTAVGKDRHFALFEEYDLHDATSVPRPTYAQLAEKHALPVTQVTNLLAWARRRFRDLVRNAVRASAGSEEDYCQEMHRLFGEDGR